MAGLIAGSVAAYAFAATLSRCAPSVGRVTMDAVVAYESGGHPFATGDNTTRRSYVPARRDRALRIASAATIVDLSRGDEIVKIDAPSLRRDGDALIASVPVAVFEPLGHT